MKENNIITDEYKIKTITDKYDSNGDLFQELNNHLESTLSIYLENAEQIEQNTFVEMQCYLMKALLDCEDYDSLEKRINLIIDAIRKKEVNKCG